MRVGIVGQGRFGAALGALSAECGHEVFGYDAGGGDAAPGVRPAADLAAVAAARELVVLAVPVAALPALLPKLAPLVPPDAILVDVASVKVAARDAFEKAWTGPAPWQLSHPLFGPASLRRHEADRRVVLCPNERWPDAEEKVRAYFASLGATILSYSPEAHDRAMAATHSLAFFIAKALNRVADPEAAPLAPPSYRRLERVVDAVREDAGHLYESLQHDNPFAGEMRRAFIRALEELDDAARTIDLAPAARRAAPRAPSGLEPPPSLQETRALIDEVDRELVALLARRAGLSRRAGQAKAVGARPVRDPAREADLLADRRRQAEASGLPGDRVEEVFAAVLRLSRALQRT